MTSPNVVPIATTSTNVEMLKRPAWISVGAMSAAFHMFDDLVRDLPASAPLTEAREAMAVARRRSHGSTSNETASRSATARINKIADQLVSVSPASWCDIVARAELAAFYSGAHKFEDVREAFDMSKPHERLAAELIVAVLNLAVGLPAKQEQAGERDHAGYVYLAKAGAHYKIGRSISPERRKIELAIQLPEKLEMLHTIKTDDPHGIERYWHHRFSECRKNGEWFALSAEDVAAFKSRTVM